MGLRFVIPAMERALGCVLVMSLGAFGQSFEIADVHTSAKAANQFARNGPARGGRYEIKNASMVDLIRIAYGMDSDKILGGPSWLEMDRFDVIAKVPADSTPETQKLMLQVLLEDRFKLVLHKETKPLPTYALTAGKKPQLKEADGSEDTGCRPQASSGPAHEGAMRIMTSGPNGVMSTINLGPGMAIHYQCRNMTMAAFASGMRNMMGASLGPNQVLDDTGIKGAWNFDLTFSLRFIGPVSGEGPGVSIVEAVEKQLGLKLETKPVPTPVMVVDKVNQKPSENPPGVAEALPTVPVPTEFEVASVKPADANGQMRNFRMQPGGRLTISGMPMRFLLMRAFNANNSEQLAGVPKWVDTERFDVTAKAASEGASSPAMDMESVAPMMRALLVDRFKLTYHNEDRQVSAYSLVAGKPKMKKADPDSRTSCKFDNAPAGSPPGSQVMACKNITMAQFADRLQNMSQELSWPVIDATGLEGGWDFVLTFSRNMGMMAGGGRGGEARMAEGAMPSASEPTGAYTLLEAVEKQLGLKLESRKRTASVVVIDRLEQKPTEN